jgi:hypothetical protein
MKHYNIIAFLITIILISCLLYPWSKQNIKLHEGFENDSSDSKFNIMDEFENLFDYVLKSRNMAKKYGDKINALKDKLKNEGATVKIEDYRTLLDQVSKIIEDAYNPEHAAFILKQESQNMNIDDIYQQAKDLEEKLNKKNNGNSNNNNNNNNNNGHNIGSIKSVDSGINFNVKQLQSDKLELGSKDNIFGNETHPLMVYLNNGCLTYEANGKYGTQHCEMQNPKQYMIYRKITNRDELNKHIMDPELHVSEKSDLNRLYPFNIITPYNNDKMCLQVDNEGVSFEDCRHLNSNDQQKWVDFSSPRAGCGKIK